MLQSRRGFLAGVAIRALRRARRVRLNYPANDNQRLHDHNRSGWLAIFYVVLAVLPLTIFYIGPTGWSTASVFSRKQMLQFEKGYSKAASALRRLNLTAFRNGVRLREPGCLLVLLLVLAVGSRSAGAADPRAMREGTHEGAEYTISMPSPWNGGLVMFAHGYEGEGPGLGGVRASPLDFQLTEGGYAWAASGYRSKGYRPDWFLTDMLALRARFIKEFGQPRWTIIHGQSMGGHVRRELLFAEDRTGRGTG